MLKLTFLILLNSVVIIGFCQSPGGVGTINLTSWFKADQQIFLDLAATPSVLTGDDVRQWNNLVANPSLPSVTRDNANRVLNLANPYHNFNDVIVFTSDYMMRAGITQGSILCPDSYR